MTREEALKVLDTIPTIGDQVDALEMAIEALSARPTGEWVKEPDTGVAMLRCSVCDCRVQEDKYRIAVGEDATKCPYCGAQLDKGGYTYDEYATRGGEDE